MRKINCLLLFVLSFHLSQAQKDTSSPVRKNVLELSGSYAVPPGGDFGKYYKGAVIPGISYGYKLNSFYTLGLSADLGWFSQKNIQSYVADKQYRLLVNAPPYTELTGGGLRYIGFSANAERTFRLCNFTDLNVILGLNYGLFQKSPVDGTDSTGTYQILEHYVNEKAFGISGGARLACHLAPSVDLFASLKYTTYFTSYVSDSNISFMAAGLGFSFHF